MKQCKGCKPKIIPTFPAWDDRYKHWDKDKKEKLLRELCCAMNRKEKKND